jgi:hypothetical protein
MKRWAVCLALLASILSCQVIPTPPPLKSAPRGRFTSEPAAPALVGTTPAPAELYPAGSPSGESPPGDLSPGDLPAFPSYVQKAFSQLAPAEWQGGKSPEAAEVKLPASLEQTTNPAIVAGLTERQRALLERQGFIVLHTQEAQFADVRERVSLRYGQPYYLTSDAAYHALHLAFEDTQAALEREELLRRMLSITQAALAQVQAYKPLVQGKDLQADVQAAESFLGVALKLFDPNAVLDEELSQRINPQVKQILAGGNGTGVLQNSVLFPDFQDDYSAYRPTGHYAGDPALEAYFRGMTWYSRVNFPQQGPRAETGPVRLPLVITLALRQSGAADEWARVDAALNFFKGERQDPGPAEFAGLMDQAYGRGLTVVGLADQSKWELFREFALDLPAPQVHAAFGSLLAEAGRETDWRFMGRRYDADQAILKNLIYERVGSAEKPRDLPSGLDMMAALGSPAAVQWLESSGETAYATYPDQMARLQSVVRTQEAADWLSSAFGVWLYAYSAQLADKSASTAFPAFMRSPGSAYRDLNSAVGSWAERRYDTTATVKETGAVSNSSQPVSGAAPAYVEANPQVFYRLAHAANAAADGLEQLGMKGVFSVQPELIGLNAELSGLMDLGDHLQRLGDVAAQELRGQALKADDWALIQAPLGLAETLDWQQRLQGDETGSRQGELPPVPALSSIAGSNGRALQVGVGLVDRIYVLVPSEDKPVIAQGAVYTYYEFPQRRIGPFTNEEWRSILVNEPPVPPSWAENLFLADGNPVDVLAFRPGDIYRLTPAAGQLNLRAEPGRFTKLSGRILPGDYVKIVDGPEKAGGSTWWKLLQVGGNGQPAEGWAEENQAWYTRAWGQ